MDVSRSAARPRLGALQVGRRDWHNDFQSLVLDLQDRLDHAADETARATLLRKLRRALEAVEP